MVYEIIFIVIAILEISGSALFIWKKFGKTALSANENIEFLTKSLEARVDLEKKFAAVYAEMIPFSDMYYKGKEYTANQESLKAERGRITITKAELESVENRLMELDVIEQELEASSEETKQEIEILSKKQLELEGERDALLEQITALEDILSQSETIIAGNEDIQNAVSMCRESFLDAQSHVGKLLNNIKAENDQYFVVKQRYDALDIEYAQLFEKFSLDNES